MSSERAKVRPANRPDEQAFVFECEGAMLPAVLHRPVVSAERGVLVIVGGPQYRIGSHRQFVHLSRGLAAAGYPVLRFDYRGMGDAEGELAGFERVDTEIRLAIDVFVRKVPTLREVVLWGLCDAASAAIDYAWQDPRVRGLVLLNPWVRTEAGEARAYLRHYYFGRLVDRGFWQRLLSGRVNPLRAAGSLLDLLHRARTRNQVVDDRSLDLPVRMVRDLKRFQGQVLLVLSGQDLTADEFRDVVAGSPQWQQTLNRHSTTRLDLPEANHTFSRREWRDRVSAGTVDWLRAW
ncbi:MAG: hydrolase 1, exosortase A system-associated [Nitrococcus sp.]|nr:hydrolase 1, exosortase A system-associated [Nitrococcus sp.]